jgi:hypothetical protein
VATGTNWRILRAMTIDLTVVNQRLMSPYFGDLAEWLCKAFRQSDQMAGVTSESDTTRLCHRIAYGDAGNFDAGLVVAVDQLLQ